MNIKDSFPLGFDVQGTLKSLLQKFQQIFVKCLLCASFCYKLRGYCKKQNRQKTLALMKHTF